MAKALKDLTASDVMQTDVVTVDLDDSLQEAMSRMTENHVTGLPILDRRGRCVGVVSATDILNFEQDHVEETSAANLDLARHFDQERRRWEDIRVTSFALEEFSSVPVSEIMSRDAVSVVPDAPLREVAKKMVDHEVHRILAIDTEKALQGVVSAFDFVRLFADRA